MADDIIPRLQRAALEAKDPADREWAAQRLRELAADGQKITPLAAPTSQAPAAPVQAEPQPGFMERTRRKLEPLSALLYAGHGPLTMGLWPRLAPLLGLEQEGDRERLAREHPTMTALGRGTGGALSAAAGPMRAVGGAAQQGIQAITPALSRTVLGRAAQTGAAGGLSGATEAAVESAGNPASTLTGLGVGTMAGFGGQVLGEGVEAAAKRLSPTVKRFFEVADEDVTGAVARPESGLKPQSRIDQAAARTKAAGVKGDEAVQRQAERSLDDIRNRQTVVDQTERGAYGEAKEQLRGRTLTPEGREVVRDRLFDVRRSAMPETPAGKLIPGREGVYSSAKNADEFVADNPELTAADLWEARQTAGDLSKFGTRDVDPTALGNRQIYRAYNEALHDDAVAPGLREADARYTAYAQRRARENDLLMSKEQGGRFADVPKRPDEEVVTAPVLRVPDELAAMRNLKRYGDTNVPGLERQRYLNELSGIDPAYQGALQDLEAAKLVEATRPALRNLKKLNFNEAAGRNALVNIGEQNARALGKRLVLGARALPQQAFTALPGFATGFGLDPLGLSSLLPPLVPPPRKKDDK